MGSRAAITVPFSGREVVRWMWLYVAVCTVVGIVGGLFWRAVVALPAYRVTEGGRAVIGERELRAMFGVDAWFVLVGTILGTGLGYLAWRWFRPVGWLLTLIAAAGALLAATACWACSAIGAGRPFYERLAAASPGDMVPVDFTLHAPVAVLVWAGAAMLPILVGATFLPDPDDPRRGSATDGPATGPRDPGEV